MKASIRYVARALRSEDRGIALPVVLGIGMVMLALVAAAMSSVGGGVLKARTDENTAGAVAAAYAGVEDYQARLSNDATYWRYGNPSSAFTIASNSQNSVTVPAVANPAFGLGANTSTNWASVPGSTDAYYRYEVDNSNYQTKGQLRVRSTGRVGNSVKSVVADLKQNGFIDYLYFTDYETAAPAFNSNQTVDSNNQSVCAHHYYDVPARAGGCDVISFGSQDTLSGPVRSNDTMSINGATFNDTVTTSSTTNPLYIGSGGTFNKGVPVYAKQMDMPLTNGQMRNETYNDIPATVPRPGCMYTGPTQISFETVNGVGKMRVFSPWTKYTQTNSASTSGATPAQCGKVSELSSSTGALIDVLDLNLVFVQAVPSDPTNKNYWAPGTYPSNVSTVDATSNTVAGWKLTGPSTTSSVTSCQGFQWGSYCFGTWVTNTVTVPGPDIVRYPRAGETVANMSAYTHTSPASYGVRSGDLFVSGVLIGHTTLAAENNVWVTGDLRYSDRNSDILGLVGGDGVFVYNPMNSSGQSLLGDNGREIDAAILAVTSTFQVQNFNTGSGRGTLTIFGAIAQKFRGIVYNGGGYAKDYQYDTRYKTTAPPKFLTPVSTTYGVSQYAQVAAGFLANGLNGADGTTP